MARRPTARRPRPAPLTRASSSSEAPVNAAARRLAELAAEAQRAAQTYARDSGLDKKAAAAATATQKAAAAAAEEAAQRARTLQMRLEREHGLSRRWERMRRRADEAVADADAKWGVRRRLRSAADTAQRRWPAVKARGQAFFATPAGQAVGVVALVLAITSGALWSMLSLLWVAWWFLIPVNLYMAERRRGEARKAQAQAAQQAQRQQQQQASGSGFWGAFGGRGGQASGGGASGAGRYSSAADSGPVIDAEYTVIEPPQDDSARRR
jgi:hypothetical protein